ncbi:MAG: gliding motility-associated protein GldE [Bacteroidota bacterium]
MDLLYLHAISFVLSFVEPITLSVGIGFVFLIILLICSALISGSEMAFFSIDAKQAEEIKANKKYNSTNILKLLSKPQKLLATILISGNFVNISIVIISTYIMIHLVDLSHNYVLGFLLEFVVVTSLILLFGEMLPKIYANQRPLVFANFMATPMLVLMKLFHPLSYILTSSTSLIEKKVAKKKQNLSFNDLSNAIEITSDEATQQQERKILKGIVKFGDTEVSGVMKPRIDVFSIEFDTLYSDLLKEIKEAGFSRIPVYKETFDHVAGILHIKDLLQYLDKSDEFAWQNLIRAPYFIPENKKISDLLTDFKEKKIHIAIVADEYGGTSGIVTMEDIIEEIVGEISDEFDEESDNVIYTKIDDHNYLFEGKTSLNDFFKIINISDSIFDEVKGEAESLAGLILEITGSIPKKNQIVEYNFITFTIESSDNRRIKKVKVTINPVNNDQDE